MNATFAPLRPEFEVALEPLTLPLLRLQDPLSRPLQLLEACPELSLQPPVLHRDAGGRSDCVKELVLILQGRVEQQRRDRGSTGIDHPGRPSGTPLGGSDRQSGAVAARR